MKPWYQYRFEKIGYKDITIGTLFDVHMRLSKRLTVFVVRKAHSGGIFWVYERELTDWRSLYGCVVK